MDQASHLRRPSREAESNRRRSGRPGPADQGDQHLAGLGSTRQGGIERQAGDLPGVSDIYVYMLVGWANYYDDITLGGDTYGIVNATTQAGGRPCGCMCRRT